MPKSDQQDFVPIGWLDCRSLEVFTQGHLPNTAHFSWPELQQRLNELPAAPADLGLIAPEAQLDAIQSFLREKGYNLVSCLTDIEFTNSPPPGLVVGLKSARLWSPNPLLQQVIQRDLLQVSHAPLTALDLGCGGGRDAVFLAEQGWQVTAIDQEQRVIERAKTLAQNNQTQVNWRVCDVRRADCLPASSFDLILMMRFLNRDLYPYIRRHTRPGGYVLIQTFVEGVEKFGSPKNPQFILQKGELAKEFAEYEVIIDKIEHIADGRPVASFLARNPKENTHD